MSCKSRSLLGSDLRRERDSASPGLWVGGRSQTTRPASRTVTVEDSAGVVEPHLKDGSPNTKFLKVIIGDLPNLSIDIEKKMFTFVPKTHTFSEVPLQPIS